MLMGLLGLALALNTAWILLAMVPFYLVIRFGVIAREEVYLERKFGDAYLDYRSASAAGCSRAAAHLTPAQRCRSILLAEIREASNHTAAFVGATGRSPAPAVFNPATIPRIAGDLPVAPTGNLRGHDDFVRAIRSPATARSTAASAPR
jgi:hypothetical protein